MLEEAEEVADVADPGLAALLATARAWHQGAPYSADETQGARAVEAARRSGDPVLLSAALDSLMIAAHDAGRMRDAHAYARERMRVLAALPRHDAHAAAEIVDAHHVSAGVAIGAGDLQAALSVAQADATDYPLADHPYFALPRLIRPYALTGRFDECLEAAEELWQRWLVDGARPMDWMRSTLVLASMVHALRGGERLPEWLTRVRAMTGDDRWTAKASHVFVQARTAVHLGTPGVPDTSSTRVTRTVDTNYEPYAAAARAELAVVAAHPDTADRLTAARRWAAENDWAAACLTRARGRLTGDPSLLADAAARFGRIGARFERACTLDLLGDPEGAAELAALRVPPETPPALRADPPADTK